MEEKELYRQRMNTLMREYKSMKSTMCIKFIIFLLFSAIILAIEWLIFAGMIDLKNKNTEFVLGSILMALLISCVITILSSTDTYSQNVRSQKSEIFKLFLTMKDKGYSTMSDEKYLEEKSIITTRKVDSFGFWPKGFIQWFKCIIAIVGILISICYCIKKIDNNTFFGLISLFGFMGYLVDGLLKNTEERKKESEKEST